MNTGTLSLLKPSLHSRWPFRLALLSLSALWVASIGLTPSHARLPLANQTAIDNPDENRVSVAVRHDVLPYVTGDGTGGLEIELVKAIFNETIYSPEFKQLHRVRMIRLFENNSVDGLLTSNVTLNGEGCLTDWYIKHQNVGVTLAAREMKINQLTDIGNLSIITFDGAIRFLGPKFAVEAKNSPRYMESSDQNSHISLLYLGYFEAAIGDEWILKLAQVNKKRKSGDFQPLAVHRILPTTLYAARFHKQAVCDAFNEGLTALRTSGRYDAIINSHFGRITAQIEDYEKEIASALNPGSPPNQ